MTGYEVKIVETSKELTAKERIQLKDTTDAIKLDKATQSGDVEIDVDYYAELSIHNERADDKDYANYVIVVKSGEKYVTGSPSFWSSFKNIFEEMKEETEPWKLKVYRMPSKNREGKDFITCSII